MKIRWLLPVVLMFLGVEKTTAQLCLGSLGDPVVNITFGSGTNPGPPLKGTTTNLIYTTDPCAVNGYYTLVNSMKECFYGWHVLQRDHTGDPNGYFMLIDASFEPSVFYLDTVRGLCPNTTYEFGAWILNLKNIQNGIRPDISFTIETPTGDVLGRYFTGDVPPEANPQWRQYGFFFTTTSNISSVVLRMANRAPGGDGNDLALDDITFRPCGPKLAATAPGFANDTVNVCSNDTAAIALAATVSAGYNNPSFQWQLSTDNGISWKDIAGATSINYLRKPTAAGNFIYRLTVAEMGNISVNTCRIASNEITVMVNAAPVVAIAQNGPVCEGNTQTLTASGGTVYNWKGPGNFAANTNAITVQPTTTATKYFVTVSNAKGCSNTDSISVVAYPKPIASFNAITNTCVNSNMIFTNTSTVSNAAIISSQWDFGDGNPGNTFNSTHAYSKDGSYTVWLIVNTDHCADTATKTIVAHPLPQVNFVLPEVCLNDAFAQFKDSSQIRDNSEASFSYLWRFGDANATAINPDSSLLKDAKHSYSAVGIYAVNLKVTTAWGCTQSLTKSFTVNGAVPVADFTISSDNFCSNLPVTLVNKASVNFGSITRLQLDWDMSNTAIDTTDENPVTNGSYVHNYPVFGSPDTKSVTVKMIAYSGISCVSEKTTTFALKASPQVQFNPVNPVCENITAFALNAASNTNALAGRGEYSGPAITGAMLFDPSQGAGSFQTRYDFYGSNGCNDFAIKNITVLPKPVINAGEDKTLLEGGSVVLNATASGNNLQYLWQPAVAMDNNKILQPKVSPVADQQYSITITSSDGCVSTDDVMVTVLKTPVVPNAFSPNGDGINDVWTIRYLDSYPSVDIQVFDRYGRMVYTSTNYNKPWDGSKNGKPLPVGTYYYIINRHINTLPLTGSVTIIR